MVLRRMLKWDLIDMTYVPILKTMEGEHRWDGKPLVNVPHFSELKPQVNQMSPTRELLCACLDDTFRLQGLTSFRRSRHYVGSMHSLICPSSSATNGLQICVCWQHQVQDQIDAMTLLDQELYNVAVERYEKVKSSVECT